LKSYSFIYLIQAEIITSSEETETKNETTMVSTLIYGGQKIEQYSLIKVGYTEVDGEAEVFGWFFIEAIEIPTVIGNTDPVTINEEELESVFFHGKVNEIFLNTYTNIQGRVMEDSDFFKPSRNKNKYLKVIFRSYEFEITSDF
jgi:hypothetical protein